MPADCWNAARHHYQQSTATVFSFALTLTSVTLIATFAFLRVPEIAMPTLAGRFLPTWLAGFLGVEFSTPPLAHTVCDSPTWLVSQWVHLHQHCFLSNQSISVRPIPLHTPRPSKTEWGKQAHWHLQICVILSRALNQLRHRCAKSCRLRFSYNFSPCNKPNRQNTYDAELVKRFAPSVRFSIAPSKKYQSIFSLPPK